MSRLTYEFYQTRAWRVLSKQFKRQSNGLCAICLRNGDVVKGEIVHHIIPLTDKNMNDPSISLNPMNLEMVCRQCHAKEHEAIYEAQSVRKKGRRYTIDESGRVELKNP